MMIFSPNCSMRITADPEKAAIAWLEQDVESRKQSDVLLVHTLLKVGQHAPAPCIGLRPLRGSAVLLQHMDAFTIVMNEGDSKQLTRNFAVLVPSPERF